MDVQKRITELMEERNWTEYRLAKESGLAQSTIFHLFRRNNEPTLPTLRAICDAFGISMAQFFAEGKESVYLSGEQTQLLDMWGRLSPSQRESIALTMRTFLADR